VALKELLLKNLRGRSVLDVGCGSGAMVRALAERGLAASGLEPDRELYGLAVRTVAGLEPPSQLLNINLKDLSERETSHFESFLLLDVLEHIEADDVFLLKLSQLMPSGSQLLLLVPALTGLFGKRDRAVGHYRRYDRERLKRIFSPCGFRSVEVNYWNALGTPVYWFFEKILGRSIHEGFRLQTKRSFFARMINNLLLGWFRAVENRTPFPIGLSFFVKASK